MSLLTLPAFIKSLAPFIIGVTVLVICMALYIVFKYGVPEEEKAKPKYIYKRKGAVMTPAEIRCYRELVLVAGSKYILLAQVHLDTFLSHETPRQNWKAALSHIQRKSVDFVLCDKETFMPLLAIELDDWSHGREDRKERDEIVEEILKQANMPLLRTIDTDNLAEKIKERLTK